MFKQRPSNLHARSKTLELSGQPDPQAIRRWQQRLFKNSYTRAGRRFTLKHWSVKIQHAGRRHTFSLAARTKTAAAAEAKAIHKTILAEGWEAAFREHPSRRADNGDFPKTDPRYWRQRLLRRRYPFPAPRAAAEDLTVRVEHAGIAHFFPLGTTDSQAAGERARGIYQTVVAKGWPAACRRFAREVTVGFEWSVNPLLWTYTTLHTLPREPGPFRRELPMGQTKINHILLLESDPGISRALIWAIQQQAGFAVSTCDSAESFPRTLELHQPRLILANRRVAEPWGITTGCEPPASCPNATVIAYSVYVDSDQLFLATPGGMGVYLLNRVAPANVLAPLSNAAGDVDLAAEAILRRVQHYFKGLLQPPATRDTSGLARLTRRERDVLALISKGYIDKEIAPALGISTWTVRGHIKRIFERLNVHKRTEAVVQYLEK
ncbi:MAG TPA: response regulator transcription factor [Verrucomicrobiota bacterium]|nr:response regulator transcription factor [Verrucomicrobiota bacterium]HNT16160.1 response regulator transcription factor [Verrucomicrobiota bacterium]